jgi:glycosyltransferase involved in cell wall biosynthesis
MKRLAIIVTHPIQYYTPVFTLLAQQIDIMVFYTWGEASMSKYDPGFGKAIKWDIDLLSGYYYQWVNNIADNPGSHRFNGIDNPDLIDQIISWQPDTLLVYGWAYKSHLKILTYFKNKLPILFRGDSILLSKPSGLKDILRTIYLRWVYKHIDYALYVGSNNKAYFKKYGLKDAQLIFAPHAVDNGRFMIPYFDEATNLRAKLNIAEDAIVILYAGKFDPVKNLELLLAAFIKLNHKNTHLLLAGNGAVESKLKRTATNSIVADKIHFLDFVNQSLMPALYQSADLFCLPSISETWGLGVNEAMACGKAILVSDKVGCATDLVEPSVNGYIHKASSSTDLYDKLYLLLSKNKQELSRMGQRSAQIIENWNIAIQVNNIINYKNG